LVRNKRKRLLPLCRLFWGQTAIGTVLLIPPKNFPYPSAILAENGKSQHTEKMQDSGQDPVGKANELHSITPRTLFTSCRRSVFPLDCRHLNTNQKTCSLQEQRSLPLEKGRRYISAGSSMSIPISTMMSPRQPLCSYQRGSRGIESVHDAQLFPEVPHRPIQQQL
jgi:hypothetical protein